MTTNDSSADVYMYVLSSTLMKHNINFIGHSGTGKSSEKQFTSRQLQGTKRRYISSSFEQSGDLNKSSSLQPLDFDGDYYLYFVLSWMQ